MFYFEEKTMETKKSIFQLNIVNQQYNENNINLLLEPLEITKQNGLVVTKYEDKIISRKFCSEKYGVFDFKKITNNLLEDISTYIKPDEFSIRLIGGYQELKILADKFEFENTLFQKMFVLSSSSNGQAPLIINAGLFRQVCSNGLMAAVDNNQVTTRVRHYEQAVANNVEKLKIRLPQIERLFESQMDFIKKMKNEEISFRQCLERLIKKTEVAEKVSMIPVIKKLGNKLIESQTDKLEMQLTENQVKSLKNPIGLLRLEDGYDDISIVKNSIYNCYTEIFRFNFHAVNERENIRISKVLLD